MKKSILLFCMIATAMFTFNSCEQDTAINFQDIESTKGTQAQAKGKPEPVAPAPSFTTMPNDDSIIYCIDGNNNTAEVYTFWAGQTIDAGTVTVGNDDTYLYVTVYSTAGFQETEENVKMWLGTNMSDMPANAKGTPIPGKFPYKYTVAAGDTSVTFQILLTDISTWSECGDEVFIVVHGDVLTNAGDSESGETAFAGDNPGDGPRWWYYIGYTTVCCEDIPDEDPQASCETAFAYGGLCFNEIINTPRWGWSIGPLTSGTYSYPIYAGAGQCDINKGTLVGTLSVIYDGSTAIISYTMSSGFIMDETHLYVGSDPLPTGNNGYTVAPGQYGNIHDLTTANADGYTISGLSGAIYIVAHAVVCEE